MEAAEKRVISPDRKEYLQALETQPVDRARNCVVALRHCQRKVAFRKTLKEGNELGHFKVQQYLSEDSRERVENPVKLDILELLLDAKTRWGSTRNMIQRFIYLYPVSNSCLSIL